MGEGPTRPHSQLRSYRQLGAAGGRGGRVGAWCLVGCPFPIGQPCTHARAGSARQTQWVLLKNKKRRRRRTWGVGRTEWSWRGRSEELIESKHIIVMYDILKKANKQIPESTPRRKHVTLDTWVQMPTPSVSSQDSFLGLRLGFAYALLWMMVPSKDSAVSPRRWGFLETTILNTW